VLLLYVASAFAVIEAADIVFGSLSQPAWMLQALLALVALGLPGALVLAWVFDISRDRGLTASGEPSEAEAGELDPSSREPVRWISPASLVVASVLILFGVAAGSIVGPLIGGRDLEDRSVAVLPFDNLSPDPENQYFADGIHEDILIQLSKIADLKVISRTSVLEYRGAARNITEIAAELGVAAVLEGSVRRDRDRVRITAQLIDAATDEHLWAESYDRKLEDVFAIQAEIARNIAGSLEAVLSPQEETSLSGAPPTTDFDAYEQYLRGSEMLTRAVNQLDPRLLATSVEALEAAVRMDASFVVAWAYLSGALEWSQRLTANEVERAELQRRAADAAERALGLDSELPEALYAMAFQGSRAPDAPLRADEDIGLLERALTARPNGAGILRELGLRYEILGEIDEAARYADRAVELEPRSALFQLKASAYSRLLRDFDEAERGLRLAASLSSDAPLTTALLVRERISLELARGGGLARAAEIFREGRPRLTRSHMLGMLGDFPELMASGEFEGLVLSLSPSASDPDLRCTCYRLKAWAHEIADRTDAAQIYWDSLSAETSGPGDPLLELPNADRDRFREATLLARAGRMDAAAALLQEDLAPGASDRHDTRYERAVAYAALGDVEPAVQELRHLLSVPSEVTRASLRDRIVWDPIRDHPSFRALLGG